MSAMALSFLQTSSHVIYKYPRRWFLFLILIYSFGWCQLVWYGRAFLVAWACELLAVAGGIQLLTRDQTSLGLQEPRGLAVIPPGSPPMIQFLTCSHLHMEKPKFRKANNASWSCLAWEGLSWAVFSRAWGLTELAPSALSFAVYAWCSLVMWQKMSPHLQSMPSGKPWLLGIPYRQFKVRVEELAQAFFVP